MRTSEQITTLLAALVTARGAFDPVVKDAVAQTGKDGSRAYRYADLAAILDAVMPALLANHLIVLQVIDAEGSALVTRLAHVSGEWIESVYPLKLEQTPQGFGSALTYGRRYSISSMLCLAAADDDGAAPTKQPKPKPVWTGKLISEKQRKRLFVIASNAGWTHEQIKTYLQRRGIHSTMEIQDEVYDEIVDALGMPFEPEGDHA